jgi:hypothetical protein
MKYGPWFVIATTFGARDAQSDGASNAMKGRQAACEFQRRNLSVPTDATLTLLLPVKLAKTRNSTNITEGQFEIRTRP